MAEIYIQLDCIRKSIKEINHPATSSEDKFIEVANALEEIREILENITEQFRSFGE